MYLKKILFLPLMLTFCVTVGFTGSDQKPAMPTQEPAAVVEYRLDASHSQVMFRVRHMGISTVTGYFEDFDITLSMDPQNLQTLSTVATIDAASINTRNQRRDNHLRSADFFEVETYPAITFTSTGVQAVNGNTFKLAGDLTMHGVTRPVVMDAEYVGSVQDQQGNTRVAFTASTRVNRTDYGLTWSRTLETGGLVVANDVDIVIDIQAIQQGPAN